ncbi:MAG: SH3 domain-containing protein, partial [Bacteroidota bacterium]
MHFQKARIVYLLGLGLILGACELPPQSGNGQDSPRKPLSLPSGGGGQVPTDPEEVIEKIVDGITEVSGELQELARPNQVQAWVDKLIVKAQPGSDMTQIGTLAEGEVAEYLHQRTVSKTPYTLRGQRYYQPWILIRTQTGLLGWVHEGGVRYIQPDFMNWLSGQQTRPGARVRGADLPENPQTDRSVIPGKKVGPITLHTSEADLIQLYGPDNVGRSKVKKPGASAESCTVVFPNTKDEIRITWKNAQAHREVSAVYIMNVGSSWFTPQGLRMGLPLMELTKVNQAPLSFYGFGWTYAGTVKGWGKGKLAPYSKGFYVMLSPGDQAASSGLTSFKGDK